MKFLVKPTRNLFFTGKGGVGKTSVACAAAVTLSERGRRVLLVSTDPASNLDEVLGVPLGTRPTPIPALPGLFAMNINPEEAARQYRDRVIGPFQGVLPDQVVAGMAEQLSGSCTIEIAAFDEFSRLLADPETTAGFDHVLFDTAPTGHTLRLLSLPSAWTGFLKGNTSGASCLGPLSGLQAQQKLYQDTVAALADAAKTTLVLVTRPEKSPLVEAERTSKELAALGVTNQHLVVNAVFRARVRTDPVAAAMEKRGQDALAAIPPTVAGLPQTEIALNPNAAVGIASLRTFGKAAAFLEAAPDGRAEAVVLPAPLNALIDEIEGDGRGVIMTMGKGGVGKTTVAAAVAVELVRRGHRVHLSTTDPAAHVAAAVGEGLPGLTVGRIDPKAETAAYSAEVLAESGAGLDAQGRALLEEDLKSPCTEEVAVFRAFAREVDAGREGFVVLDTAPTGHTILLMDAAGSYHREATRQSGGTAEPIEQLLPRLRDPGFTRILVVTLPEATPVHEAAFLQADLRRAGIEPFAWVINQSLSPLAVTDPVLVGRKVRETPFIREVVERHAKRTALVPWLTEVPVGNEGLLRVVVGAGCGERALAGVAQA